MLDYASFPEQRQDRIRAILQENGRVVCAELATQMSVSEHTIRRDLHELSKEGICKKVYGGAVLQLPDAGNFFSREQKNTTPWLDKCCSFLRDCVFYRHRHDQSRAGEGDPCRS